MANETQRGGVKRPRADESRVQNKSASPAAVSSASRHEPKRVACIHCRQSKLRCDAFERDPCSRCDRLKIDCTKDSGYKRVSKRSKVDELEQELHQLKTILAPGSVVSQPPGQLDTPTASPSTQAAAASLASFPSQGFAFEERRRTFSPYPTASNSSNTQNGIMQKLQAKSQIFQTPSEDTASSSTKVDMPVVPPATRMRAIESTALSAEHITDLFQSFFQNHHPFLPFLDPLRSADTYHDTSPLLFWTIITVASRNWSADKTLVATLYRVVQKMAWASVAEPPLCLPDIQALLLLCLWPSTNMHVWSDISVSFSTLAMNSCMHIGLHRPDHFQEFTKPPKPLAPAPFSEEERVERGRTWAACNIVAQYVTANLGIPPVLNCFDWALDRACEVGNRHSLPVELRHHLILQRFSHRVTKIFSGNRADPVGYPAEAEWALLTQMLEEDLSSIEAEILPRINTINRIILTGTRFYLQSLNWLRPHMTPSKRAGVLRSYATACALLDAFLDADKMLSILPYAPVLCVRHVVSAGYIIYKIHNSSFRSIVSDISDSDSTGDLLLSKAQTLLKRMSVIENDVAIRCANILQDIWSHRGDDGGLDKNQVPALALRSRLSRSLTNDALIKWRTIFTKSHGDPSTRPGDTGGGSSNLQQDDPMNFSFNWDLFEDLDWSWASDMPLVEDTLLTVAQ